MQCSVILNELSLNDQFIAELAREPSCGPVRPTPAFSLPVGTKMTLSTAASTRLVLRELHAGVRRNPVLVLYCCLRMNGFRLIRLEDKADCCLDQEAWLTVDMLKSGTRTGGMAARVK